MTSLVLPSLPAMAASPRGETVSTASFDFRDGIDLIAADLQPEGEWSGGTLKPAALYRAASGGGGVAAPEKMHPMLAELRDGLEAYRSGWGSLPQVHVSAGPTLRIGQRGERVALLRERLGLPEGNTYDVQLAEAVRDYRRAHALPDSIVADAPLIASLNRGAHYYEQLIRLNMERLRALPALAASRYILVDAAAARLWLYENGRSQDSMKVVVGKTGSPTPMLATHIRWAELSPYWNVPPDLAQKLVAPRVLRDGVGYLATQQYEVLSDWTEKAEIVDPTTVDWRAVAAGRTKIRIRQQPGPINSMGEIKFMMRNDYGIYLHDTPNKELFAQDDRWQSNGCVRVEDARRLARWLFQGTPRGSGVLGEVLPVAKPVPVFITYLTVGVDHAGNVAFRPDRYGRDINAMARWLESGERMQTASRI